jgi:hypothetical protein
VTTDLDVGGSLIAIAKKVEAAVGTLIGTTLATTPIGGVTKAAAVREG